MACKAWNHEKRGDLERYPYNRVGRCAPNLVSVDDGKGTMREDWRRLLVSETGNSPTDMKRTYLPISCMHCDDPACMRACPVGRIRKELDFGTVYVQEKIGCLSCGLCAKACPWDSPQFWKPVSVWESKGIPAPMTKCDFCYERIRAGDKPACTAACPTRALYAGPEDLLLKEHPGAIRITSNHPYVEKTGPHFWVIKKK